MINVGWGIPGKQVKYERIKSSMVSQSNVDPFTKCMNFCLIVFIVAWKKAPYLTRADCPDSVVSGIGSGTLGFCARTEKKSSNKLIRYVCNQLIPMYLSGYICQKRKIGKTNLKSYYPAQILLTEVTVIIFSIINYVFLF